MTWYNAIEYALSNGKFIPSKEQAEKMCLAKCWTSTTDDKLIYNAYISGEKLSFNKMWEMPVIMVDKLESKQEISYRKGDVEY